MAELSRAARSHPGGGPAHLAGRVPVHAGDHDIAEVLQLPGTALGISALVLEVQLLGQGALQVLGATWAAGGPGWGPAHPST